MTNDSVFSLEELQEIESLQVRGGNSGNDFGNLKCSYDSCTYYGCSYNMCTINTKCSSTNIECIYTTCFTTPVTPVLPNTDCLVAYMTIGCGNS